jgi:hypothetical protein
MLGTGSSLVCAAWAFAHAGLVVPRCGARVTSEVWTLRISRGLGRDHVGKRTPVCPAVPCLANVFVTEVEAGFLVTKPVPQRPHQCSFLALARQYDERRSAGHRTACTGQDHPDKIFFKRDRGSDFELRFVPAARDSSMWWLLHFSNCGATVLTRPMERKVGSSRQDDAIDRRCLPIGRTGISWTGCWTNRTSPGRPHSCRRVCSLHLVLHIPIRPPR